MEIAGLTQSILISKNYFLHAGKKNHVLREYFLSTKVQVLDLKRELSSFYYFFFHSCAKK